MRKLSTIITGWLLLTGILAAQNGWVWQNPLPQGNTLYALYSADANTMVAAGATARCCAPATEGTAGR